MHGGGSRGLDLISFLSIYIFLPFLNYLSASTFFFLTLLGSYRAGYISSRRRYRFYAVRKCKGVKYGAWHSFRLKDSLKPAVSVQAALLPSMDVQSQLATGTLPTNPSLLARKMMCLAAEESHLLCALGRWARCAIS